MCCLADVYRCCSCCSVLQSIVCHGMSQYAALHVCISAGLFLQMSHCKYWLICGDDVVLLSVCTRVLPLIDEDLCCHMLQYVAVCCSMLQYVAICCIVSQCAVLYEYMLCNYLCKHYLCCSMLQYANLQHWEVAKTPTYTWCVCLFLQMISRNYRLKGSCMCTDTHTHTHTHTRTCTPRPPTPLSPFTHTHT